MKIRFKHDVTLEVYYVGEDYPINFRKGDELEVDKTGHPDFCDLRILNGKDVVDGEMFGVSKDLFEVLA